MDLMEENCILEALGELPILPVGVAQFHEMSDPSFPF
jgi:hypothetical protein